MNRDGFEAFQEIGRRAGCHGLQVGVAAQMKGQRPQRLDALMHGLHFADDNPMVATFVNLMNGTHKGCEAPFEPRDALQGTKR